MNLQHIKEWIHYYAIGRFEDRETIIDNCVTQLEDGRVKVVCDSGIFHPYSDGHRLWFDEFYDSFPNIMVEFDNFCVYLEERREVESGL
jgi:hypothetical protein